jgi:hypothetical protein
MREGGLQMPFSWAPVLTYVMYAPLVAFATPENAIFDSP